MNFDFSTVTNYKSVFKRKLKNGKDILEDADVNEMTHSTHQGQINLNKISTRVSEQITLTKWFSERHRNGILSPTLIMNNNILHVSEVEELIAEANDDLGKHDMMMCTTLKTWKLYC